MSTDKAKEDFEFWNQRPISTSLDKALFGAWQRSSELKNVEIAIICKDIEFLTLASARFRRENERLQAELATCKLSHSHNLIMHEITMRQRDAGKKELAECRTRELAYELQCNTLENENTFLRASMETPANA